MKAVLLSFAFAALMISPMLGSASPLSSAERKLAAFVDAHNAQAEALLERAVNVNSGTMNFDGVREVGKIFRAELDALGFTTRWVDGTSFHRAGHLIGEFRGTHFDPKSPRLLLIGHLDTVFEKDNPFRSFERLPGGKARGPGVIDMKGGDVVMIHALKALRSLGALDRMSVAVIMTGDEEKAGDPLTTARQELVELAKRSDVAIGFEDGSGKPTEAIVARRGSSDWVARAKGTPAHSSQIFRDDVGSGAIFEISRILDQFRKQLAGEKYLTFSPGVIVGGTTAALDQSQNRGSAFGKSNVVAGEAAVEGDLRTVSPEQLASAKARMREIVAGHLPKTEASIEFDDGYPPMAPTDGNRTLLALYDRASRDLGLRGCFGDGPHERRRGRRRVYGGQREDGDRRGGTDGNRRPHGPRDRRPRDASHPDEARRAAALPAIAP